MITFNQFLSEILRQHEIHFNTNVETLKNLARDSEANEARFVYKNRYLHAGDSNHCYHHQLRGDDQTEGNCEGFVYYHKKDGSHTYEAFDKNNEKIKDGPLIKKFQKAGMKPHSFEIE